MTRFGREINGVPEAEINRVHAEARRRLNRMERDNLADRAKAYRRLAEIENPRLRAMAAPILLGGMHAGDPPDLEEYAEATSNSAIDAAFELSRVGGFRETPDGIITGDIRSNSEDLPEEPDDDDDGFTIASVEAQNSSIKTRN